MITIPQLLCRSKDRQLPALTLRLQQTCASTVHVFFIESFLLPSYEQRPSSDHYKSVQPTNTLWAGRHQVVKGVCGRRASQRQIMWSAVWFSSPHMHEAVSLSPHWHMFRPKRPTPVLSLLRWPRDTGKVGARWKVDVWVSRLMKLDRWSSLC